MLINFKLNKNYHFELQLFEKVSVDSMLISFTTYLKTTGDHSPRFYSDFFIGKYLIFGLTIYSISSNKKRLQK